MKCIYEVTTKYYDNKGTNRNCSKYNVEAKNMKEAITKVEAFLKKNNMGNEKPDEVRFIVEVDVP